MMNLSNIKDQERPAANLNGDNKLLTEIRIRGKNRLVPSVTVDGQSVVVAKRWPRVASLKDEQYVEKAIDDPVRFVDAIKLGGLGADLFTFAQIFPDVTPRYSFHMEMDNLAALSVTSYEDWLNNQINGNMRKILRRSSRRGVSVCEVDFTDDFVRGVVEIYNETPFRQQRRFWHYGKTFETVKAEASTYLDRSVFLGAFLEGKLIGFIKVVFVGRVGHLMHIVSMAAHMDKLPNNALIAKAVEICEKYNCSHLIYGKYSYGNAGYTSLTEFKNRNGFKKWLVPRYFIPLTIFGKVALTAGIHQGFRNVLPEPAIKVLLDARAKYISFRFRHSHAATTAQKLHSQVEEDLAGQEVAAKE